MDDHIREFSGGLHSPKRGDGCVTAEALPIWLLNPCHGLVDGDPGTELGFLVVHDDRYCAVVLSPIEAACLRLIELIRSTKVLRAIADWSAVNGQFSSVSDKSLDLDISVYHFLYFLRLLFLTMVMVHSRAATGRKKRICGSCCHCTPLTLQEYLRRYVYAVGPLAMVPIQPSKDDQRLHHPTDSNQALGKHIDMKNAQPVEMTINKFVVPDGTRTNPNSRL
ncbi:hypothetical protein BDV96DRAFT_605801 [Lophiotrema nucula]|uniref:Uncharacterized protein n=1 Tax=Lophiotrema nucula TaxID=690887 RepID=A0A6A5YPQ1_9PLEO|nr:hypothetical protein BDV96DRAFT_605801 [Lophiotrema nucula]